jgi:agmatine deiminase
MYKPVSISLILLFILLNGLKLSAQDDIMKNYRLTHSISPAEKELMKNNSRDFTETNPPVGEVRPIAEWEPMESVLIAYDGGFGLPLSAIAEMSQDCNITTIVSGPSEETTVRTIFTNNGVNLSRCDFIHQDPDSWWTRDYSPWYIAVDNTEVAIVDFPYNRPRPNDDDIPILMAGILNEDLYGMNVEHTGGNYMNDGIGIAVSTDLVWEENTGQTHQQISTKFLDYLGVETYHVTADPLDDYIKHVDCWAKFLDVDKILITQVPVSDYRYSDYEALASYFSLQNCSWGYPYHVYRVQAADYYDYDTNPYTNSLILNDKVFVPQSGSSLDDDALAVYVEAMPGYEIIGVYSSQWINSDALHCRAHGVADRAMLHIEHLPVHDTVAFQPFFVLEADIFSYGGSPISVGYPKLFYRQNGDTWQEVVMTNTTGPTYTASIPGLSGINVVEYYIAVQNDNNKFETHPYIGQPDPHTFTYNGESVLIYPNPSVCIGSNTGNITLTNYTGTITDWEKRFNEGEWQSIGFIGDIYSEYLNDAGTWDYRVELDNGSLYSTVASILVYPLTVGGSISGGSEICEGESTGVLSLSGQTGSILAWQKRLNAGDWTDIVNIETTYEEIPSGDGTWSYRVLVQSGVCTELFSEAVDVLVDPNATASYSYTANALEVTFINASLDATGYSWDFGDGSGSSVENPIYSYNETGTYTVTLRAYNGSCWDEYAETINVSAVSTDEIVSEISIDPNPNNGKFTLLSGFNQGTIRIFNLNGQELFRSPIESKSCIFDIPNLYDGMYLIEIESDGKIYYKKLIVR